MIVKTKNTDIDITRLTLDFLECKISSIEFEKILRKLNKVTK